MAFMLQNKESVVALDERLEPASQPPPKRAAYTALYFFSRSGKSHANNHLFRHGTVSSVEGTAERIVQLLKDWKLRRGNEIRFRSS
jgi:hypothetical protein